ncbi:hypothetical protein U1Q18_037326 [Sarracenia purpurea var. burkii]
MTGSSISKFTVPPAARPPLPSSSPPSSTASPPPSVAGPPPKELATTPTTATGKSPTSSMFSKRTGSVRRNARFGEIRTEEIDLGSTGSLLRLINGYRSVRSSARFGEIRTEEIDLVRFGLYGATLEVNRRLQVGEEEAQRRVGLLHATEQSDGVLGTRTEGCMSVGPSDVVKEKPGQ